MNLSSDIIATVDKFRPSEMGGLFFFGAAMDIRKCILDRSHYKTNMAKAFLKAIGVEVQPRKRVSIAPIEISGDVYECFKNRRHVNL